MLRMRDLGNVDDGGSWEKLKNEVEEAVSDDKSQMLRALTERVFEGLIRRFASAKPKGEKKKIMIIEKKGFKLFLGSGTKRRQANENEDDLITSKQKKQKTTGNNNEQNQNLNLLKNRPIVELTALGLEPPPDMPQEFKKHIKNLGGTEIKLVIQKFIQVSDLKRQQCRLSMPLNQVRSKFLSEAEEQKLANKETIDVTLVEPCLRLSQVKFYWWRIGSSNSYIFRGTWKDVVKNNADSLKPMAVVQIWSFRFGPKSKLGFAMIKVRDGEDGHLID
ncbi:hypothetical protein PTKIN_Ptkin06aG0146500 [Pterospermum kingtungense]